MAVVVGDWSEGEQWGCWETRGGTVGAGIFLTGALLCRYQYPSLDQLADMIPCILQYLK